MIEVTVRFDDNATPAEVAAKFKKLSETWETEVYTIAQKSLQSDADLIDTTEVKTKKATATKATATKAKKQAKPVDDDSETFDLDSTDTEDESTDSFDDDDAEDEIDQSTIIQAFQKYSKKHSREKAAAALAKFKVKSVLALKASDYPAVLKFLGK